MRLGRINKPDDPQVIAARAKADAEAEAAAAARRASQSAPEIRRLPDFPPADQVARDVEHWKLKLGELAGLDDLDDTWQEAVRRGLAFVDRFGKQAAERGWSAAELFDADELPMLHGKPPVPIGPALVIPLDGAVTFVGNDLLYRPKPQHTHISDSLTRPTGERTFRQDSKPLGRICWAVSLPRKRAVDPRSISHGVGVLGSLRWTGPTSAVLELPLRHADKIELQAQDILALVAALGKSPPAR